MFKPTEVKTPKSESFNESAPGTGQAGDPGVIAPPKDLEKSLFQPIEVKTPKSESFNESAPGTGQAGDPDLADSGSLPHRVYEGPMPQQQSVKDDRGTVTTFISDLPQK